MRIFLAVLAIIISVAMGYHLRSLSLGLFEKAILIVFMFFIAFVFTLIDDWLARLDTLIWKEHIRRLFQ